VITSSFGADVCPGDMAGDKDRKTTEQSAMIPDQRDFMRNLPLNLENKILAKMKTKFSHEGSKAQRKHDESRELPNFKLLYEFLRRGAL
jgi:hypothetical protein